MFQTVFRTMHKRQQWQWQRQRQQTKPFLNKTFTKTVFTESHSLTSNIAQDITLDVICLLYFCANETKRTFLQPIKFPFHFVIFINFSYFFSSFFYFLCFHLATNFSHHHMAISFSREINQFHSIWMGTGFTIHVFRRMEARLCYTYMCYVSLYKDSIDTLHAVHLNVRSHETLMNVGLHIASSCLK